MKTSTLLLLTQASADADNSLTGNLVAIVGTLIALLPPGDAHWHELRPAANLPRAPRVVIATWCPRACFLHTRFYPEEILEIQARLGLPEFIRVDNGCTERGDTALAIMMARLAIPSRHYDLTPIFGRDKSILGRIVRHTQSWLVRNWGGLLQWSVARMTPEHLQFLADSLVEIKDCPLKDCVGYVDGTVWKISRPSIDQRKFYNGHKRSHALKFQAVTSPDGITVDLTAACLGARHDMAILAQSNLVNTLRQHAKGARGQQMYLYGDKGYTLCDVIMIPYGGVMETMPRRQQIFNSAMTQCRIGVEHEFGRTRNVLRMTQYKDNLRFFLSNLEEIYHVSTILKNLLICLGRGPGGVVPPPSLEEYLVL